MSGVGQDYYQAVLEGIGAPVSPNNLRYMAAWQAAEGGTATNNAFNTTEAASGATNYNSVGVKNYPDEQTGIMATVKTLLNGRYNNLVNDMRADADPKKTAGELDELSTWGTGAGVLSRLGSTPAAGTPPSSTTSTTTVSTVTPTAPSTTGTPAIAAGGIGGTAMKIAIFAIAGLAGSALIVGGLWKSVEPARDKLQAAATKAAQAGALAA